MRSLLISLQSGYERDRRKVDPRKDKRRCFEWEQVMETLRLMREKLELHAEEGKGKERPRLYHDFIILLLFTTVTPNRYAILFEGKRQHSPTLPMTLTLVFLIFLRDSPRRQ